MDTTTTANPPTREGGEQRHRLAQSLQHMVDEAEQLLHTAQASGSEKLTVVHDKLEHQLHEARAELAALQANAAQNVRRAAHAADHAVHEHPYAAMGLATGVGVLIGMLISRR